MHATSVLILAPSGTSVLGRLDALVSTEGHRREAVGPLLLVHGDRPTLERLALSCASALTVADAAATRAVVLDADPRELDGMAVLGPAMQAPPLSLLAARDIHGRMLDALAAGLGAQAMYQPVIEIRSGRTTGFEALLRLDHDGRAVPPVEVFGAAADAGRLAEADAAARRVAIATAAGWIGGRSLHLNLLPEAIVRPEDLDDTDRAVAEAGLEKSQLVFEASIPADGDFSHLERVLTHLRARGYGIALDDATAEPAVLDLVERLRPRVVKVARQIVQGLPALQARSAVANIVGAAHVAGAVVVAKGIETAAQLDAVWVVGVEAAQGWQVGQPMQPPGRRVLATASV
ncbi:MAG TPA: EAL domain-containing protein [Acidimicrobiales bacterium]|nr:EAL domain-containing protein [Acidimicrobiales bacterium]